MTRNILASGCLLLAISFIALGLWQIERRAWKLALIAQVEDRIHAEPQALPRRSAWAGIDAQKYAYTRIHARGAYLHDRETLVQAVTELGPGWWVMTPLRTDQGLVMVNRGFVPADRRDPASRPSPLPGTEVSVTGLLRVTEPTGAFLRKNDPSSNRWYSRDIAALAAARGLHGTAPFFIDADATPNPSGYPVGGLTVVAFRNAHLAYALTWLGLAGLSALGATIVLRSDQHT